MVGFLLASLICTIFLTEWAHALSVEVHGPRGVLQSSHRQLVSRSGGLSLNNSADISYYADIALGNQTFKVLVDTGSSDLWVSGNIRNSSDTGLTGGINYAANSVKGAIKLSTLNFAGHLVVDQAFLEVPPDEQNREGTGILGLGPSSGSFISKVLPSMGTPILNRIFSQNATTANYFTILLGRAKDPTDTFSGNITVGEVLSGYETILNEPKLAIIKVPDAMSIDQHMQILLDQDGLIGPDGKAISIESVVGQTANKQEATVVLDCGFTLPQMPRSAVDAIYSRFQGAEFVQVPGVGGSWILPCEQEVNVTFVFSGKPYPMHPLDMSMEFSAIGLPDILTADGERACIGTFQPFTYDRGRSPNYDMVLGMAFMRNAYSLFNYGNFVQGSTNLEEPYVQLLSITNATEAHQDFVTVRLRGNDTTATRGLNPPGSVSGGVTIYYIIAAVVVVVIFVAAAIFILCSRRRRGRSGFVSWMPCSP